MCGSRLNLMRLAVKVLACQAAATCTCMYWGAAVHNHVRARLKLLAYPIIGISSPVSMSPTSSHSLTSQQSMAGCKTTSSHVQLS